MAAPGKPSTAQPALLRELLPPPRPLPQPLPAQQHPGALREAGQCLRAGSWPELERTLGSQKLREDTETAVSRSWV